VPLSREQCAYYHKLTNRIVVYDMSGLQIFQEGNRRPATRADIQRFLSQESSYHNITAVIHEATHQVGFNTGMHPRNVLGPMWIYEGLAVFHETPDPRNNMDVGWTPGPHVNRPRLEHLRRYLAGSSRSQPLIQKMICEDDLFKQPHTALDNYALSWGLMYYFDRRRPKELSAYLRLHQSKTLDSDDSKESRLKDFESCFGDDWDKFYRDFFEFVRRL